MPQVSPMSWLVIPSFFFLVFFTVFICMWWVNKSCFEFKNDSLDSKVLLEANVWVW